MTRRIIVAFKTGVNSETKQDIIQTMQSMDFEDLPDKSRRAVEELSQQARKRGFSADDISKYEEITVKSKPPTP